MVTKKSKKIYICTSCGNEFAVWVGQCSACGEWNTITEITLPNISQRGQSIQTSLKIEAKKLNDIDIEKNCRITTTIGEFDRVLGGGIIPGSIILIGGEPGIGKSTLLLQTAGAVLNTLYVTAEESAGQIKERAERLGVKGDIQLIASGDLEAIEQHILVAKPFLIIIDSIQTVYLNAVEGTAGSLLQVRECGIFLQRLAKISGIPIIIVGHVTKDGSLAGPRLLEHIVDVVLYFEGDRYRDARILRGIKNRFGATNEVGIFSIQDRGLVEIKNPSEIFLKEYENNPGNAVTVALEGTRPILVEVQALVMPTNFGYPKRTSSGFDLNRLNLLAAVISKSTEVNLSNADIYLNIVGGMKIAEPAADLAVCAAIVSSFKNKPITKGLVLFGEVGLSGEVRSVSRQSDRLKEIKSLGYTSISGVKNLFKLIEQLRI